MSKTIELRGNATSEQISALRALGVVADVRGGNPIVRRARDRHDHACGRGRFTKFVAVLSKADGSDMTAADVRAARASLGSA